MKTLRIPLIGAIVATATLGVAGAARADGQTVVLNTFNKVWVAGDALGPMEPQAKGFINGIGSVPNPGYTPTGDDSKRFMPEVSSFSVSVLRRSRRRSGADAGLTPGCCFPRNFSKWITDRRWPTHGQCSWTPSRPCL
jgi:hypothetical protein